MKGRAVILVVFLLVGSVSSDEMSDLVESLKTIAAALGILLIAIQGLKYVTAESPDDRAEAKKGLIWIIVGLLVAAVSAALVCGLYCQAISVAYGGVGCSIIRGVCTPT